jgi:hypothetical protein
MQRTPDAFCQPGMRKINYRLLPLLAGIFLVTACSKDLEDDESVLYGRWVADYGDTLIFSQQNGKNVIDYSTAPRPTPFRDTIEYVYNKGKLGWLASSAPPPNIVWYNSFRWLKRGKSFELHGSDLFSYLSSSQTLHTYTKIH